MYHSGHVVIIRDQGQISGVLQNMARMASFSHMAQSLLYTENSIGGGSCASCLKQDLEVSLQTPCLDSHLPGRSTYEAG